MVCRRASPGTCSRALGLQPILRGAALGLSVPRDKLLTLRDAFLILLEIQKLWTEALTCVCATQAPDPAVSSSPWTSTSWSPPQPAGIQAIWEPSVCSLTLAFSPLLFPLKVRVVSFA